MKIIVLLNRIHLHVASLVISRLLHDGGRMTRQVHHQDLLVVCSSIRYHPVGWAVGVLAFSLVASTQIIGQMNGMEMGLAASRADSSQLKSLSRLQIRLHHATRPFLRSLSLGNAVFSYRNLNCNECLSNRLHLSPLGPSFHRNRHWWHGSTHPSALLLDFKYLPLHSLLVRHLRYHVYA